MDRLPKETWIVDTWFDSSNNVSYQAFIKKKSWFNLLADFQTSKIVTSLRKNINKEQPAENISFTELYPFVYFCSILDVLHWQNSVMAAIQKLWGQQHTTLPRARWVYLTTDIIRMKEINTICKQQDCAYLLYMYSYKYVLVHVFHCLNTATIQMHFLILFEYLK